MAGQVVQGATRPGLKNVYTLIAYLILLQAFTGLQPWQFLPRQLAQHQQYQTPGQNRASAADTYFKPMADLVLPHGYQLEEHFVTTGDGYVLRMFRIPPCRCPGQATLGSNSCYSADACPTQAGNSTIERTLSSNNVTAAPVVFMQHALMDTSAGWLLLGPKKALALQLADAGFDVWMTNTRGNRYSRNHTHLDPDLDAAFWQFNVDDLVEYDLPASIQYVQGATGKQRMVYIGYSQGTMIGLAALASQPQLASSISMAVLMAPVAFTTAMTSPAFALSARLHFEKYAASLFGGNGEWGSFQQGNSDTMMPICRRFPGFCLGYLTAFCGKNPNNNINPQLVPLIFQHLPAGTSVNIMGQWAQGIRRACRRYLYRYDFGIDCSRGGRRRCNQEVYGQHDPPPYDLATINTPIALFTGGQDTISSNADIALLKEALQPGVLQLHHHQPDYAHLDFELGSDAPAAVYPELLALVSQHAWR